VSQITQGYPCPKLPVLINSLEHFQSNVILLHGDPKVVYCNKFSISSSVKGELCLQDILDKKTDELT